MTKHNTSKNLTLSILLLIVALLAAGCGGAASAEHRYTDPSEYYLYVPEAYSPDVNWPLFIGIHGAGGSGRDCWNTWQKYADSHGFILLCPSLAEERAAWSMSVGEAKVNKILNIIWPQYSIQRKYYMAGISAGAFFIQGYANDYPGVVSGLSIISSGNYFSVGSYPQLNESLRSIPILITIGSNDTTRLPLAQQFAAAMSKERFWYSYHVIEGVGHSMSQEAIDLTLAWFMKVHYGG